MAVIRQIAHFDLDAFFVSVEQRKNSKLIGIPLIVGGGSRGVVAACSYEARKFGVHSAMPMRTALYLCPDAVVISGDYEDYSKYSRLVTEVIAANAPLWEKASIDEFYVDLSGMDKYFKTGKYLIELRDKVIRETGLDISCALATNKLVSKVATNQVKPKGQTIIPYGNEKSYLAPLIIEKMPMIGPKTAGTLRDMGVSTIKLLSEIPVQMLTWKFGKNGTEMSRRSNGIDETPVIPFHEQKSISTEQTFTNDTIDIHFLRTQIVKMTEQIAFEMREQGKLTGCITIKIRYADFNTLTKQTSIPYTASDHLLIQKAKEIFEKLYDRRLLVRLIGIRYSDLVGGHPQISIFDDTQEMVQLYQAIDKIKRQFGANAILRGTGLNVKKR